MTFFSPEFPCFLSLDSLEKMPGISKKIPHWTWDFPPKKCQMGPIFPRCFSALAMAFRRAGACALRRRLLPTFEPSLQTRALHVSAARLPWAGLRKVPMLDASTIFGKIKDNISKCTKTHPKKDMKKGEIPTKTRFFTVFSFQPVFTWRIAFPQVGRQGEPGRADKDPQRAHREFQGGPVVVDTLGSLTARPWKYTIPKWKVVL